MDPKRAIKAAHPQGSETGVETGTVKAGLVGRGITLSRSPAMHEAEGKAQGLDLCYRLFDLDDPEFAQAALSDIVEMAERQGYAGLNITFPFKIDAMSLTHALSRNAETVGAVNTIVFRDGRRYGHNTDLWGFAEGFRTGMPGADLSEVLLVGAGGAGYAVAHALLELGVGTLWLFDIEESRAETLAGSLVGTFGHSRVEQAETLSRLPPGLTGIVNATPVGMAKLPGSPVPRQCLHAGLWVADIVYFPLETQLLSDARAAGCPVLSGSGMAVFQAVRAFELFTGRAPNPDRMKRTFESLDD